MEEFAPKKPLSSYSLWSKDMRPKIITELGNIHPWSWGLSKELGKRWSTVDQETKDKYGNMAERAKEEYKILLATYTPPVQEEFDTEDSVIEDGKIESDKDKVEELVEDSIEEDITKKVGSSKDNLELRKVGEKDGLNSTVAKKTRKKKLPKDPTAPKKPLSAYILWSMESKEAVRAELGNLSITMMARELGKRWASVDQQTKARYEKKSGEEKEKYKASMENYTPSMEYIQKLNNAKFVGKKIKDPNAPKKPLSSYSLWSNDMRPKIITELGNISMVCMSKELGKRWSTVDQETKDKYGNMAERAKEEYKILLATYTPPVQAGKVRKLKDPNAPKRGLTGYQLFMAERRNCLRSENPELKVTEVMAVLAGEWKNLDPEMKERYRVQSQQDRQKRISSQIGENKENIEDGKVMNVSG